VFSAWRAGIFVSFLHVEARLASFNHHQRGSLMFRAARSPTSASSERTVAKIPDSEPWKEGGGEGKYQYAPGGDPNAPKKDAPSALNVVIIPNVTLPKVCCSETTSAIDLASHANCCRNCTIPTHHYFLGPK
jgi:hypothetical protein